MRKVGVFVLLVAIAAMLATFGAGWKWFHGPSSAAGTTSQVSVGA